MDAQRGKPKAFRKGAGKAARTLKIGFAFASSSRSTPTPARISTFRSAVDVFVCSRGCYRWLVRTANGRDEPCGCAAMDALAWTDNARAPGCREHFLFRLSLQLCARVGTPHLTGSMVLASSPALKMDRHRSPLALFLGV